MYEIRFFKKEGGTGRIYVWGADLEKARLYLDDCDISVVGISEMDFFEWIFRAYFKEPEKRFRKNKKSA